MCMGSAKWNQTIEMELQSGTIDPHLTRDLINKIVSGECTNSPYSIYVS